MSGNIYINFHTDFPSSVIYLKIKGTGNFLIKKNADGRKLIPELTVMAKRTPTLNAIVIRILSSRTNFQSIHQTVVSFLQVNTRFPSNSNLWIIFPTPSIVVKSILGNMTTTPKSTTNWKYTLMKMPRLALISEFLKIRSWIRSNIWLSVPIKCSIINLNLAWWLKIWRLAVALIKARLILRPQ